MHNFKPQIHDSDQESLHYDILWNNGTHYPCRCAKWIVLSPKLVKPQRPRFSGGGGTVVVLVFTLFPKICTSRGVHLEHYMRHNPNRIMLTCSKAHESHLTVLTQKQLLDLEIKLPTPFPASSGVFSLLMYVFGCLYLVLPFCKQIDS